MRELDLRISLRDNLEKLWESCHQKNALPFLMLYAIHEEPRKLNDVKSIFFDAVDILNALKEISIQGCNDGVYWEFLDE